MPDRPLHRVGESFIIDANGKRFAGTFAVHVTRVCGNCAHDGASDPEWVESGSLEFGRCMNLCTAANFDELEFQWCGDHQTPEEYRAGIHCIERPVLVMVPRSAG